MEGKGADIVERIDTLLNGQGQSRKALVSAGVVKSVGVITAWLTRGTVPRADTALAIANYLGVSVSWLITGRDEQGLTLKERNLLVKYRSLDERGQYEVNALLDAKLEGNIPGQKEAKNPQGA
jgi:transcriptional regulator with XRE-family HTH domain